MSLTPTAGARFLLERTAVADDERSASYRASIHTPDRRLELEAVLALDEPPRLTASGLASGPTDDALQNQLMSIAKQVSRAAENSRASGLPVWPRRVLRWKGPGRGG